MRFLKYCAYTTLFVGACLCLFNVFSREEAPAGPWGIILIVIGVAMVSIFLISRR
ncbi:hypothetical protein JOE56_000401 [Brevibacterium paucivorans]|uniref:PEP-CTERM protein-sorting domain-containing protein n=1 Tax=Brevibacterium paucivorans TaxID=170994 RepID=A0ABS2SHI6_9MICO|nr:hypothetical protein [Brevibacterium paucivorans]MBM7815707.1 hypothetical protein [Brevibacterium paucivorans]